MPRGRGAGFPNQQYLHTFYSTIMTLFGNQVKDVQLDTDHTSTILPSRLLVKIRQDLKKDKSLLVTVAARALLSHVPYLASELRTELSYETPIEELHPMQLGSQKGAEYREFGSGNI